MRPLAQVGRDDVAVAGGKGANLGELVRLGVAVPPGFRGDDRCVRRTPAGGGGRPRPRPSPARTPRAGRAARTPGLSRRGGPARVRGVGRGGGGRPLQRDRGGSARRRLRRPAGHRAQPGGVGGGAGCGASVLGLVVHRPGGRVPPAGWSGGGRRVDRRRRAGHGGRRRRRGDVHREPPDRVAGGDRDRRHGRTGRGVGVGGRHPRTPGARRPGAGPAATARPAGAGAAGRPGRRDAHGRLGTVRNAGPERRPRR